MIKFLMVDVQSVTSGVPRSDFSEADLDILADLILESGGILKPLVLKKTGFEKYEVINGDFEYYAAVRAREKNPSKGEMVNALIISPENEQAMLKQAEALREPIFFDRQVKVTNDTTSLVSRLANIELRFEKQINQLRVEQVQERQRMDDKLKQIESQMPKQISPLEAFNNLGVSELILRLGSAGLTGKKAETIVQNLESQRQKKKFVSLTDVVKRIDGLSDNRMVAIIDSWSQISFR